MSTSFNRALRLLPGGLALLLCACGGGGGSSSTGSSTPSSLAVSAPGGVTQSNSQIAALIYSDTQRTPGGFYVESVPVFSGYVATSHLKTTDVNSSAVLRYELCSDDFNQALQWSETANTLSGDHASLTGNDSTARYFEFDRIRNSTPQGYLRQRVYKCAYLNRNTVDLQASSGDAGTLNVRPLDVTTLKQLSEYLWQFTGYNNFGNVVLSSNGASGSNSLTHSLIIASLVRASSAGACDTINVIDWKHTVDTATGELTLSLTPLFSFHAQESNGAVSVCS
ncbi:MAG: hypothetical protein AB7T07_12525 [Steroidobacteraceae bacterium]